VFVVAVAFAFSCPKLAPHNASSIFELKPSDIKVVMALGDSITAGFSINNGIMENRGQSWSIGGDPDAITVPTILQSIVPHKIVGASVGTHIPELPFMPYLPSDHANGAQSNAIAQDLMKQINHVHSVVSSNPDVNMHQDWKLLTILIGANNVCYSCKKNNMERYDNGDKYETALRSVLERTRELFPRTFVNLVLMFNVSQVYYIALPDKHCFQTHEILGGVECSCAFGKNNTNRMMMDILSVEYNKRMYKIADDFNSRGYKDFAVVIQPMLQNMKIPDLSYLSHLDCFHPDLKAHRALAVALWNTMFLPAAKKPHNWEPGADIFCPNNDSILYAN
jgi:hypothetical protein